MTGIKNDKDHNGKVTITATADIRPRLTMRFSYFDKDENLNPVGDPHFVYISGNTADEINDQILNSWYNNDVTKHTHLDFCNIIKLECEMC